MVRFAEAAAVVFIFNIKSPVGICRADLSFAYTSAVLLVPEGSRCTFLWCADACATIGIVDESFFTSNKRCVTLASAFFSVKEVMVVKIILAFIKEAFANTFLRVPCFSIIASFWSALTFAVNIIPEEVVWALDWTTDTGANCFIPNLFGTIAFP
jgi:hypothetical protein